MEKTAAIIYTCQKTHNYTHTYTYVYVWVLQFYI